MIIVETERLILRHFHIGDSAALHRLLGDSEVMRYGPGPQPANQVPGWLQACLQAYATWGFGRWAAVEKQRVEVIGYCGLTYYPEFIEQPETELGYRLIRACWGRGYAAEAASTVRDYAFGVLCLPRPIAIIDPANTASIRVACKLGMVYKNEVMLPGYSYPDHVYAVTSPFAQSGAS